MPTPVYDFTWKGQSAHDVYGVETLALGSVCVAERRDDSAAVAGRSGLVHRWDGAVEEVEQTVTLYLPYAQPGRTVAAFAQVRAWLKGYGRLTLSTEPGSYRLARITDLIALDPVVEGFDDLKGQVIFRCDPYLYHVSAPAQTLTAAAILTNPGTAAAAPTLTVTATGDVDLLIGGQNKTTTSLKYSEVVQRRPGGLFRGRLRRYDQSQRPHGRRLPAAEARRERHQLEPRRGRGPDQRRHNAKLEG